MGRMIDADALLTDSRKRMYYHLPNGDTAIPIIDIEHAPTIEERKTGEWIRKISVVDCATFVGDECSQCEYFKSMGQANFCPNCGADMRGGNT